MLKRFLILLMIGLTHSFAQATEEYLIPANNEALKLLKFLNGRTLRCQGNDQARPNQFSFSAKRNGSDIKIIFNARTSVAYGGQEFDDLEFTKNWILFSLGDDGRRYIHIQHSWLENPKCKSGNFIPGIIATEFSGIQEAYGIDCCFVK